MQNIRIILTVLLVSLENSTILKEKINSDLSEDQKSDIIKTQEISIKIFSDKIENPNLNLNSNTKSNFKEDSMITITENIKSHNQIDSLIGDILDVADEIIAKNEVEKNIESLTPNNKENKNSQIFSREGIIDKNDVFDKIQLINENLSKKINEILKIDDLDLNEDLKDKEEKITKNFKNPEVIKGDSLKKIIKKDIKNKIKEDLKEDIKQDIKKVIKEDVKENIKDDIKKVIKEDVKEDIKENLNEYIEEDIKKISNGKKTEDNINKLNYDVNNNLIIGFLLLISISFIIIAISSFYYTHYIRIYNTEPFKPCNFMRFLYVNPKDKENQEIPVLCSKYIEE